MRRITRGKIGKHVKNQFSLEHLETRRLLAGDSGVCFEPLDDITVQVGSPLHIPIDASDIAGGPITVSVDIEDDDLLEGVIIGGNRSIRIQVDGFGEMVFELFEQRAPLPTSRVIELAESGFYDGIEFHRVIDDFVIQAGDPTGTGIGGSLLGNFDDQFHPDLQHNRPGVLSFAKNGDDTNNSQFFITESAQRHLDFNHSVFGLLVEGEDVRDAISEVATDNSASPLSPVTIQSIDVFQDLENSVVLLSPRSDAIGSTTVTFTVTNTQGETFSQTIDVDVAADTANSQPYLLPLDLPIFASEQTAEIQLSSFDIEGDPVEYSASTTSSSATVSIDDAGLVTVVPNAGFEGTVPVRVTVLAAGSTNGDSDNQLLNVVFSATTLDLLADDDSGVDNSDDITNETSPIFIVSDAPIGETVELVVGDQIIGSGTVNGQTTTITNATLDTLGDGTHRVLARTTGDRSTDLATLDITLDTAAPTGFTVGTSRHAVAGQVFQFDLNDPEEGTGITYTLINGPSGAIVDPVSGLLQWLPTENQLGEHSLEIRRSDIAGNAIDETLTISVFAGPIATVQLEAVDLNGIPIDQINVGEEFLLNLFVTDNRDLANRAGLFSAYADIGFDEAFVSPLPVPVEYHGDFNIAQSATLLTGMIDELGASSDQFTPSFQATVLVATVRMIANEAGNITITSSAATSEFLAYNLDDVLLPSEIEFTSIDLSVFDPDFHRESNPFDVDGNGSVTALDALIVINVIGEAGQVIPLDSPLAEILRPEFAYNVARDGQISALDALRVINFLAEQTVPEAELIPMSLLDDENENLERILDELGLALAGLG